MHKNTWKAVLLTILLFYAVWLLGAFWGFLPFIGDDLPVREIAYCACMICVTVVLCTCHISAKLDTLAKDKHPSPSESKEDRTDPNH